MVDLVRVVKAVRSVLPEIDFVPLHEPKFSNNALNYVSECVETGWVSTAGSFVTRFEDALQKSSGAKHVIAVSSGTNALHLCLLVSKVKAGDEVICPGLSFVATANAIKYVQAIPHFIDVSSETMSVDAEYLNAYLKANLRMEGGAAINVKTGRRVSAFLGVHAFGFALDANSIRHVCDEFCLEFIEDAACSIGSEIKGTKVTSGSRLASMSFNGNKLITCGGGGAVLTNCSDIAFKVKHLSTTAKKQHQWEYFHDKVGFNYRLPNINAALGLAELENLEDKLAKKRALFQKYKVAFQDIDGLNLISAPPDSKPNYWLICARLDETNAHCRDDLLRELNDGGMMSRPLWFPLNKLPMFTDYPSDHLKNVQALYERVVCLPSSPHLNS